MGLGPQSLQSLPYSQEAPLASGPPSWQTPLVAKAQASSHAIGGGGGGGGGLGSGGVGGGERSGAGEGGGGGAGGTGGDLPQAQQCFSGEPYAGPCAHSWPKTAAPPAQCPSF